MIKERQAALRTTQTTPSNGAETLNEIMEVHGFKPVSKTRVNNSVVEINGVKVSYKGAQVCEVLKELGPDVVYPKAKRVLVERGLPVCSDTAFTKYMRALWGKGWVSSYVRTNGTKVPRQHPWKAKYVSGHMPEQKAEAAKPPSVTNFEGPGFKESVRQAVLASSAETIKACFELWKGSLQNLTHALEIFVAQLEKQNGGK